MKAFFKSVCLFFAVVFVSCSSLQDVDIESLSFSGEIFEFEKRFAYIDASYIIGKENEKDLNLLIEDIEKAAANPGVMKAALAHMYAIEGCCLLLNQKSGEAKKMLELSSNTFKGDTFASILALRLDSKNGEKNSSISSENHPIERALLVLEEALRFYKEKNYLEAVARFDSAFISLNSFYRDAYGQIRDKCWNLRSVSAENAGEDLLTLQKISVMQMILIAEKKSDHLYNYTGGKKMSDRELYVKIAGSGLLNPVSNPLSAENSLSADYTVNKLMAGRFLWNLYNISKNTQYAAARYSVQYKKNGRKSPVKDVELENADFDAVLGCVEKEIMNLDDGVNFNGNREISAVEFNESLKKLK